jgi:hypothetical protein
MPAGTGSGPEGAGFLLGKHRSGKEESARKACYRLHPAPGIPDPNAFNRWRCMRFPNKNRWSQIWLVAGLSAVVLMVLDRHRSDADFSVHTLTKSAMVPTEPKRGGRLASSPFILLNARLRV